MTPWLIAPAAFLALACSSAFPQDVTSSKTVPVEYGTVRWSRQLDPTLAKAKDSGKPVLLCFQEVPG